MAKRPFKRTKIHGLTLEDIREVDPRAVPTEVLQAYVQKMADAGNKRIRRLLKSGKSQYSPALQFLRTGKRHKGKVKMFTGKLKNAMTKAQLKRGKGYYRAQLLKEFTRAYTFLFESKTGSVKGAEKFRKDMEKRFPDYWDLSKSQRKDFWEAYNRLLTTPEGAMVIKKGSEGGVITSSEAQRVLYAEMKGNGLSADEAIRNLQERLEAEYEQLQEEDDETDILSTEFYEDEDGDDTPW